MRYFAALLLSVSTAAIAPVGASASDLLGPIWHLKGKHIGYVDSLSWSIEYTGQWGRTVVSADGAVFYHDLCCGSAMTADPSWIYPEQYWGQYPMYYMGTDMHYRITLTNDDPNRTYRHLRLVSIQEYFSPEGEWGEWMGEDAAKDWYIPELKPGESVFFDGSFHIAPDGLPGLNQTHIQVQHWNGGKGIPGPGSVIIDDAKAALWCPPEASAPGGAPAGAPSGAGAETSVPMETEVASSTEVRIAGGDRGYIESGKALTVEVKTAQAGAVRVNIYDRRGTVVWESTQFAGAGTSEFIVWNGNSLSGSSVPPGVYLILVEGPGVLAKKKVVVVR